MRDAPSLGEMIDEVAARFRVSDLYYGHGYDNPWDEAVALVLGVGEFPDDKSVLSQPLADVLRRRITRLATRRIEERIPLVYLLGKANFAGFEFLMEPGVVIPRSPIGQLIVNRFEPWLSTIPRNIVDVGCGCGCIGIACAFKFPGVEVLLIDDDPGAVELARRNVALHELGDRVEVLHSDLFASAGDSMFDLVISNPPYVDSVDMGSLPSEYRHEPESGLAAGDDGLEVVDRLLTELPGRLASLGTFVCEVGGSAPALLRKYPQLPFIWPDLPQGGAGVFLLHASDFAQTGARSSA
ncbi:MAG: 50S ribosomal protein L3 N(5)-glutamine methyltransferase [Gammaproteobacteria bacterium]|nr:50S ribosomal protein L3 N(5)-glutamine methyltransferase [Gammaproteobacteria bacterium]